MQKKGLSLGQHMRMLYLCNLTTTSHLNMKILITGASGFIGSHIATQALQQGLETWVAVRPTSSRRYLQDERLHFIDLDLGAPQLLAQQLRGQQFDYVVHAAGATKCLHEADFARINAEGTRHLAEALLQLEKKPKRLVFISSLSVCGAVREELPHTDIKDTDTPQPNTAYGRSKLLAEQYLDALAPQLSVVTLRPTGVYGPRERDYFMAVKSIARHLDLAVGLTPQHLTFIYVDDVVQAVFQALEHGQPGRKYHLSDGQVYTAADFGLQVRQALGQPWCARLTAPLWLLRAVTAVGDMWGKMTGQMTALNNDKYNLLKQRNWRCDITPAKQDLGFQPTVTLPEGVQRTVQWYKEQGWL